MSTESKAMLDALMKAYEGKKQFPFVLQRGAITVVVADKGDLITNIEAFRRFTDEDEQRMKNELLGGMTR